ncbi:MAG: flagellin, partial [Bacteroidetes bacterium]
MGAFGDLSRINTNIQALDALRHFQITNDNLGMRQLRLATGKRINRAEDDSAGFHIAKKLEARVRGQSQALANIGDAKSMLTVAEGSLGTIMDILQTMKEKAVQAANDTMGSEERAAIEDHLHALSDEITDILNDTKFNNTSLYTSGTFNFQVNADAEDSFQVTIGTMSVDQLGLATGSIDVSSASAATSFLNTIDAAISTISQKLADIGDYQKRLTFKQDALSIAITNNEAARSRIEDADFAKE